MCVCICGCVCACVCVCVCVCVCTYLQKNASNIVCDYHAHTYSTHNNLSYKNIRTITTHAT